MPTPCLGWDGALSLPTPASCSLGAWETWTWADKHGHGVFGTTWAGGWVCPHPLLPPVLPPVIAPTCWCHPLPHPLCVLCGLDFQPLPPWVLGEFKHWCPMPCDYSYPGPQLVLGLDRTFGQTQCCSPYPPLQFSVDRQAGRAFLENSIILPFQTFPPGHKR